MDSNRPLVLLNILKILLLKLLRNLAQHYVPENMAICISGDIDPDKTIKIIDDHFSYWSSSSPLRKNLNGRKLLSGREFKEVHYLVKNRF